MADSQLQAKINEWLNWDKVNLNFFVLILSYLFIFILIEYNHQK